MYRIVGISFKEAFVSWAWKLFCFKGRARRAEYWYPYIVFCILTILGSALLHSGVINTIVGFMAYVIAEIVGMLLFLPVAVRRLHDIGLSGFWSILGYLQVAACIPLLINPRIVFQFIITQLIMPNGNSLLMTIGIVLSIMDIAFMILLLIDGKKERNKYGDSPKYVYEGSSDDV